MTRAHRLVVVADVFPDWADIQSAEWAGLLARRGWDVLIVCRRMYTHDWNRDGLHDMLPRLEQRVHLAGLDSVATIMAHPDAAARAVFHALVGPSRSGQRFRSRAADIVIGARIAVLKPDLVLAINLPHRCLQVVLDLARAPVATSIGRRRNEVNNPPPVALPHGLAALFVNDADDAAWFARQPSTSQCSILIAPWTPLVPMPPPSSGALVWRKGKLGTPDRPVRLLTIGPLDETIDHVVALDVVAELIAKGVHVEYRIVGDGPRSDVLHLIRHQRALDDSVEFVTPAESGALTEHLEWADVVVHLPTARCSGSIIRAAGVYGLPVVSNEAPGAASNLVDGVTGIVIPRHDPQSLMAAIESLAGDSQRRISCARAAQLWARQQFTLDDQVDEIEALLIGLIRKPEPAER